MKDVGEKPQDARVAAEDASDACWAEGDADVPVVPTGAEGGGQEERPELENEEEDGSFFLGLGSSCCHDLFPFRAFHVFEVV